MGGADDERHGATLLRLAQIGLGAAVGAAVGGPAGALGGAVLGGLGEVCAHRLSRCPTSPRAWLQAFGLAGCGVGAVAGAAQDGVEGATVGAAVGGTVGCCVGLAFGVAAWAIVRVARCIAAPGAAADRPRE